MKIHTIIDNIRLSCWDWTDSYAEKHDRGVVMRFVEKARWAIKEDREHSERGMQRSCVIWRGA